MKLKNDKRNIKILKREKVMKLSELEKLYGNRMEVSRKTKEGMIQTLGSGFYATVELDPFLASLAVVAKYYPDVVISGKTALHIYGLNQDYIQKIDVDIEREKSLRNKLLQVHRVPKKRLIGMTQITYQNIKINIYDIERSLAEAYLLDQAGANFYKALKRYIKAGNLDIDKIALYDKKLKTKVIAHLQQELAND